MLNSHKQIPEVLEYSGPMSMASDLVFTLGPPNKYKNIASFNEWPVNLQINCLVASKIWGKF